MLSAAFSRSASLRCRHLASAFPKQSLQQQQQQSSRHSTPLVCPAARLLSTATPESKVSTASGARSVPDAKRVVIVGGGVIGCSVAYNLGRLGWGNDVLLLEQNQLTSGTTWHAAGLISASRATSAETRLCIDGLQLVRELERETGQSTGYKKCG
jgi:hypothetical protein